MSLDPQSYKKHIYPETLWGVPDSAQPQHPRPRCWKCGGLLTRKIPCSRCAGKGFTREHLLFKQACTLCKETGRFSVCAKFEAHRAEARRELARRIGRGHRQVPGTRKWKLPSGAGKTAWPHPGTGTKKWPRPSAERTTWPPTRPKFRPVCKLCGGRGSIPNFSGGEHIPGCSRPCPNCSAYRQW